jgi:hypothetical protein
VREWEVCGERGGDGQDLQDSGLQDERRWSGGALESQGLCGLCCGESVAVHEVFGMERGEMDRIYWIQDSQDGRRLGGGALAKSGDVRAMLW